MSSGVSLPQVASVLSIATFTTSSHSYHTHSPLVMRSTAVISLLVASLSLFSRGQTTLLG